MIHETLIYLLHFPKKLLQKFENNLEPLNILGLYSFIHPSEIKLIERIFKVAFKYHSIEYFLKNITAGRIIDHNKKSLNKFCDKNEDRSVTPGLYVKAFCLGVSACLEDYRKTVIKMENLFLTNCHINLTYILSSVEKYITLFDSLKSMICMIQSNELKGCQIISILQTNLNSGDETLANASTKIIQSVNIVFFNQLCSWIIYGELIDEYDEFFISKTEDVDETYIEGFSEQNVCDESFTYLTKKREKRKQKQKSYCMKNFVLKEELFPFSNCKDLAEIVLFIGQIVWIINHGPRLKIDQKLNILCERDVWEGKSTEYYKKLHKLKEKNIYIVELEAVIKECRLKVAEYFWNVMIKEADLIKHFVLIRDYYCLGKGDLFQEFIHTFLQNQQKVNCSCLVESVDNKFKETATVLYRDTDDDYEKFKLKILSKNEKDVCSSLELNFEIQWPLHTIFHPNTLNLYNELFCYFLRIKKSHMALRQLWLIHIKSKRKIHPIIFNLRNTLMFIVDNIQYYLQVDVIEAQFSILKESLKNAKEFGHINKIHSVFLSNLLSKTYVITTESESDNKNDWNVLYQPPKIVYSEGQNMIYKVIIQILELCDKFCFFVIMWGEDLLEPEIKQLKELKSECDALMQILFKVLNNMHLKISGSHLVHLLLRLDYNVWLTKKTKSSLLGS